MTRAALVLASLLAACGDDTIATTDEPSGTSSAGPGSTTTEASPTTSTSTNGPIRR